jgi:GntR family transcriptional regulator
VSDNAFIVVEAAAAAPPFQQIVDQVRALVQSGDLEPGAALPTVRQLAGDLRVAPNTVARAYAQLAEDGWIESDGRRGTRIASAPPAARDHAAHTALHDAVTQFVQSLVHRGYSRGEIGRALHEAVARR